MFLPPSSQPRNDRVWPYTQAANRCLYAISSYPPATAYLSMRGFTYIPSEGPARWLAGAWFYRFTKPAAQRDQAAASSMCAVDGKKF